MRNRGLMFLSFFSLFSLLQVSAANDLHQDREKEYKEESVNKLPVSAAPFISPWVCCSIFSAKKHKGQWVMINY